MARLLFVTSRFPHPLDKGDKLRAFHQIATLARRHDIALCALSHQPVPAASRAELERYCSRVEVVRLGHLGSWARTALAPLRGLPFQVAYFTAAAARHEVRRVISEVCPDLVLFQLARTAEYAQPSDGPAVIDFMDAFSRGLTQRAARSSFPHRLAVALEARLMTAYEARVRDRFAHAVIISAADREAMGGGGATIHLAPNGVDLADFQPRQGAPDVDLLFVGNMAYTPNIAAARALVEEVLPRVRQARPGTRLLIAGTSPRRAVTRLRSAAVEVTGWVDDIAACYARARVFVAPMSLATGVQNKLLQAMAMGLPCVTSSLANQSLGAGADEAVIADSPEATAAAVVGLLDDPARAAILGAGGRALVERRFRWEQAVAPIEALLTATRPGPRESDR